VERGILLVVVISKGPVVFQLLSSKDDALEFRLDTFFPEDLLLDLQNGV
jgi:hypothetical protein